MCVCTATEQSPRAPGRRSNAMSTHPATDRPQLPMHSTPSSSLDSRSETTMALLLSVSPALILLLCLAPSSLAASIDPAHARNITIYHVNEKNYSAAPVNMNTVRMTTHPPPSLGSANALAPNPVRSLASPPTPNTQQPSLTNHRRTSTGICTSICGAVASPLSAGHWW